MKYKTNNITISVHIKITLQTGRFFGGHLCLNYVFVQIYSCLFSAQGKGYEILRYDLLYYDEMRTCEGIKKDFLVLISYNIYEKIRELLLK